MSYESWTAVAPAETPVLTMDLSSQVAAQGGGLIASATVSASVWRGVDSDPSAILASAVGDVSGSPKVKFRKAAGGTAEAYLITVPRPWPPGR
jgi:hypothetical protein